MPERFQTWNSHGCTAALSRIRGCEVATDFRYTLPYQLRIQVSGSTAPNRPSFIGSLENSFAAIGMDQPGRRLSVRRNRRLESADSSDRPHSQAFQNENLSGTRGGGRWTRRFFDYLGS